MLPSEVPNYSVGTNIGLLLLMYNWSKSLEVFIPTIYVKIFVMLSHFLFMLKKEKIYIIMHKKATMQYLNESGCKKWDAMSIRILIMILSALFDNSKNSINKLPGRLSVSCSKPRIKELK